MAEHNTFLQERERRMAENRARLEAMGLPEMSAKMAAANPIKTATGNRRVGIAQRKQKLNPEAPSRRSGRNVDKVVNYSEQQPLVVYEERKGHRGLKRARRDRDGSDKGVDRCQAWHPDIPDPPMYAREKALDDALQKIEELITAKKPAFAKEMLSSMVSGGGWLQSPPGLRDYLPVDTDITFTTTDTARPSKQFRYTQLRRKEGDRNDAWLVGYLQKRVKATGEAKGGQGFSKNWKGFALDLFLHPGDYVVFEVVSSSELKVHVHRAWDYAEDRDKPEGFDAIRFTPAAAGAASKTQQKGALDNDTQEVSDGDDDDQDGHQGSETAECSPQPDASQDVPAKASKRINSNTHSEGGSRKKHRSGSAPRAPAAKGRDQAEAVAAAAGGVAEARKTRRKAAGASNAAAGADDKQGGSSKPIVETITRRSKAKQQKPEVFTVDWIVDAKVDKQSGTRFYKVHWLGYDDPAEDTWQAEDTFSNHVRTFDWKIAIPSWVPQQ